MLCKNYNIIIACNRIIIFFFCVLNVIKKTIYVQTQLYLKFYYEFVINLYSLLFNFVSNFFQHDNLL